MTPFQFGVGVACGMIITFCFAWLLDFIASAMRRAVNEWKHRRWLRRERALRTTREEDHD